MSRIFRVTGVQMGDDVIVALLVLGDAFQGKLSLDCANYTSGECARIGGIFTATRQTSGLVTAALVAVLALEATLVITA